MTIDERAYAYADDDMNEEYASGKAVGYIAGATEQKKMDIDKACEWFKKNYREYVLGGEDMITAFRKAMEE